MEWMNNAGKSPRTSIGGILGAVGVVCIGCHQYWPDAPSFIPFVGALCGAVGVALIGTQAQDGGKA